MSKRLRTAAHIPTRNWILGLITLGIAGLVVITSGDPPPPLPAPNWAAIFSPQGKVISLQGGLDAVFTPEKISNGIGVDNSVFPDPANTQVVDNGTVAPQNDLGNAYFWATTNAAGDAIVYAGVERLSSSLDSFVEFELNQGVVRVTVGAPWPIHGERTAGDLLVRVNLKGGVVDSADFKRWDGTAYQELLSAGPDGCNGVNYRYCAGAPPLQSVQDEVWDAAGHMLPATQPDAFLEIGVNLKALLGSNVEFTSIQVRTPQDVVLDSFRNIGFWAHASQGGGQ